MQAQLLWWLIQPVYPHGWIAVRHCAGRVPSTKRREDDVALVELETIDAQLLCPRIRLIRVIRVRADQSVEQGRQASTLGGLPGSPHLVHLAPRVLDLPL